MVMRPCGLRASRGFTTVELMVVIAIIAVLTAIAVPSMRNMIETQRVKTASFNVFSGMTLARSEAVKRNTTVTVTPTGGNWASGWTITDSNGNVVGKEDAFTQITVNGPATVAFNSMGRLGGGATGFQVCTTELANTSWRCVTLDLSGRPVSSVGVCPAAYGVASC